MSLLLWILVLTVCLLALRGVSGFLLPLPWVKILFLPGYLVCVGTRAMVCGLTGVPLKKVTLPWCHGPPTEVGMPEKAILRSVVIAVVPFLLGLTTILALRAGLAPDLESEAKLAALEPEVGAIPVALGSSLDLVTDSGRQCADPAFRTFGAALFLHFAFSIIIFIAPSYAEWKRIAAVLGIGVVLLAAFDYLGLEAGFLSRGWWIQWIYGESAAESVALLLQISIGTLIVVATTLGLCALARAVLATKPDGAKKSH